MLGKITQKGLAMDKLDEYINNYGLKGLKTWCKIAQEEIDKGNLNINFIKRVLRIGICASETLEQVWKETRGKELNLEGVCDE